MYICIHMYLNIFDMSRCIQRQLYIQDKVDGELCFKFVTETSTFR